VLFLWFRVVVLFAQVKETPFRSARQKKKKKERKKEIKKNKNKNKKKSLKTRRLLLRHYFRYSPEKYGQVKHRNKATKTQMMMIRNCISRYCCTSSVKPAEPVASLLLVVALAAITWET
jgi:uncharacterized membrane protein YgaE (UPF0421/DUF939 family)